MGCDRHTLTKVEIPYEISIHAPAWGATGGCRADNLCGAISIHAPAWGATKGKVYDDTAIAISIHAPAWGATNPIA